MAFQHGKSTAVLFDQYDLSAYFNQYNASRQIQAVNTTTFGKTSKTYIAGVESGSLSVQGLWDGDASAVDAVLDASIATESIISVAPQGFATIGNRVVMAKGEDVSYQIRSTVSDAVRITAGGTVDGGVRNAGVVLQPLEAETTTVNNTSFDGGAATTVGGVSHLHVTAFSGTSGTIQIQDSADNSSFALITGHSYTVTGVGAQRAVTFSNVRRYLRFAITADSFTSMTVAACFARHSR